MLVRDWLIDSDIFAVCQFPAALNMNVGASFPGSLMQCVRLSIKCVCAPVTSHVIAFVYEMHLCAYRSLGSQRFQLWLLVCLAGVIKYSWQVVSPICYVNTGDWF